MRAWLMMFLLGGLLVVGCQQKPSGGSATFRTSYAPSHDIVFAPGSDTSAFVRGQAKVLKVDPVLGQALLEINGRQVNAYWEVEVRKADTEAVIRSGAGPLDSPVGEYHSPVVESVQFPAQAGDIITFVGMKTGADIFLRGITVVSR